MSVAQNVILVHIGTNASIPTGYTRETSLDSKYPKAASSGSNPNTTGGNATHTHTSPAHSHAMNDHTHVYTVATGSGGGSTTGDATDNTIRVNHDHTGGNSGSASGGGLSSIAATYDTVSNDPPYYTVIFIKSDGTRGVPNTGVVLFDNSLSLKSNWYQCDGLNSTPDLRNKYLKGAAAGADAGGTGGSTTNTHTLTHTHTVASHTHGSAITGAASGTAENSNVSPLEVPSNTHTHTVTFDSATDTISGTAPSLVTAETVEPAFRKLMAIQNRTGGYDMQEGMIAMWLGNLTDIPYDWALYDSQADKYLKIAQNSGEVGTTGGSNTHTHASQTHGHSATGTHNHTAPNLTHVAQVDRTAATDRTIADLSTIHTVTVTATTATYADASTTADSSSNEPEYRTVTYIQYTGVSSSLLLSLGRYR